MNDFEREQSFSFWETLLSFVEFLFIMPMALFVLIALIYIEIKCRIMDKRAKKRGK